ncbi:putative caffeoyl-CoA O-methyltransferase 2 [Sesamum angolense]|uniref:Caffeoyl-CoA O-methyltransferase 2 n=1 Tax=Sesamum angolense TaxID=2727404 RepID=A0AAE1W9B0_9LAMI|nr:putative caffeoyl-CoA O-methyltransferase 2 [Sesamum angolense]
MTGSWGVGQRWVNPLTAFWTSRHFHPVVLSARGLTVSRPICYNRKALKCVANTVTDTVISTDDSYGHKEVISVNPRLYDYLLANVREPEILRELREETATMHGSQMQVSPDQAQLSCNACSDSRSRKGYSSLAVALVLPEGGQLVACERDAKSLEVASRYYERAGVSEKVKVKLGLAADTLKSMIQNGEGSSYDFAFVDAEKKMYQDYFELLLQLVRVGGVIVIDNVLWHGRVADPLVNDSKTVSIRNFNRNLMEDNRVSISMALKTAGDNSLVISTAAGSNRKHKKAASVSNFKN